jgi:hypothetical protein
MVPKEVKTTEKSYLVRIDPQKMAAGSVSATEKGAISRPSLRADVSAADPLAGFNIVRDFRKQRRNLADAKSKSVENSVLVLMSEEQLAIVNKQYPDAIIRSEENGATYLPDIAEASAKQDLVTYPYPGKIFLDRIPQDMTDSIPGDQVVQKSKFTGNLSFISDNTKLIVYVADTGMPQDTLRTEFAHILPLLPAYIEDPANINDYKGHGSHVSGIILSKTFGYVPDASLVPVKVMANNGWGTKSSFVAGLYAAIDLHQTRQSQGYDDIPFMNISIGMDQVATEEVKAVFKALSDAGFFVFIAAGNFRTDACSSLPGLAKDPNAAPNVDGSATLLPGFVVVKNLEIDGSLGQLSNFGDCTTTSFPGSDIPSIIGFDTGSGNAVVGKLTGTSMASPGALGRVAQWYQYKMKSDPDFGNMDLVSRRDIALKVALDSQYVVSRWFTVAEVKDEQQKVISAPDLFLQQKNVKISPPTKSTIFPAQFEIDPFNSGNKYDQEVGFNFHIDRSAQSTSHLEVALSTQQFYIGIADYQALKAECPVCVDPSINLVLTDLPELGASGDYWIRFSKKIVAQSSGKTKSPAKIQYFLDIGTGTLQAGKLLRSMPLPDNVADTKYFGFQSIGNEPLQLSKFAPFGQFRLLHKLATSTIAPSVAPTTPATFSPTASPTMRVPPKLLQNQCLTFMHNFNQAGEVSFDISSNPAKKSIRLTRNGKGALEMSLNGKLVTLSKPVSLPSDDCVFEVSYVTGNKVKINNGIFLNVVEPDGTKQTLLKYVPPVASNREIPINFVGAAMLVSERDFKKCIKSVSKPSTGRLLSESMDTTPGYAGYLAASAASAASAALSAGQKSLESANPDSNYPSYGMLAAGAIALTTVAAALVYFGRQYNKGDTKHKSAATTYVVTDMVADQIFGKEPGAMYRPPR